MRSLVAVSLILADCPVVGGQEKDARKIITNAVKAHGGEEGIFKLRTAQVNYAMWAVVAGKEMDFKVEEVYQLPTQMKKIQRGKFDGKDVDVTWVVNGDKYWFREGKAKAFLVNERPDIEKNHRAFLVIEQLAHFQTNNVELSFLGEKKFDSRTLIGVHAKSPVNTDFYFDKETGLLARTLHKRFLPKAEGKKDDKETQQESLLSDYKMVHGVRLPCLFTNFSNGKKTAEVRISDVKVFEKLDDRTFSEP